MIETPDEMVGDRYPNVRDIRLVRDEYDLEGRTDVGLSSVIEFGSLAEIGLDHVPRPVLRSAAFWAAGVLARISISAEAHIRSEGRGHDCRVDVFNIGADQDPTRVDPPCMFVSVPTADATDWETRLTTWLQQCQ